VFPTKVVTISPRFGYVPTAVRVRLSASEVDVISRMQAMLGAWTAPYPQVDNGTTWKIESSAVSSPTLNYAVRILKEAQRIFPVQHDDTTVPVTFIVGRTQGFIKQQIAAIGCTPSAAIVNGVYLMGATVCNRNVVVINLTGYFFLRAASQPITSRMEQRAEPALSATSYLVIDRNFSAIAHEWVHVARNRLSGEFVPDNEPAWFREGLAEVISGLARVRSFGRSYPYLHFHVIRLRKFFDWNSRCPGPLRNYRSNGQIPSGCEYMKGAIATELLLAKYGGVGKIYELQRRIGETGDFLSAFRATYGISVSTFERRADLYTSYIARAASVTVR
jgi:hypothetical protein